MSAEAMFERAERVASELTLEEKCRLLGGASMWRTHAIERVGIPSLKFSDGPNGVRGDGLGAGGTAGVAIPVGIALGATWDAGLVAELGDLLGTEAVRKGVHVLLAPTVNLQRTPIGGRVFECYSEDPELTARLAVAYIEAVQAHDVAVTVKHFVANDTEVDRFSIDARIDETAMRELYLRPFEAAVRDAGAWGVMSAYNRVDGEHCAGNQRLLRDILRDEWGFDGIVVSDWLGAHDTVASALAGLDIPMPGPATIYGEPLRAAVEAGHVDGTVVDGLVDDVLRLVDRTRARGRSSERPETTVDEPSERALCRRAVAAGTVLVRNLGALPISPDASIALIGPNAADTRIMGGGSSNLVSLPGPSILDALGPRVASLVHEPGVRIDRLPPPATERQLRTPDGRPGLRVEYRNGTDLAGPVVAEDVSASSMMRYFGSTPPGVDPEHFTVTITGSFLPDTTGPHRVSAVLTGAGIVTFGATDVLVDPDRTLPRGSMFFGLGSEAQEATIDGVAGVPIPVAVAAAARGGFAGIRVGISRPDPGDLIDRAVDAATTADVAVVVVGTNDEWETEGEDRTSITLPGDQDDLVARVAAANPATIVVVNAGSPVAMPWIDDVAAVLVAYFGGHEMGNGVSDVLLGDADPGGRLPITYPRRLEDTPSWPHYAPVDGVQTYGEGLLIGYRGFDASGVEPLFPFGHGLSYGSADWAAPSASTETIDAGDTVVVTVPIRCTGSRSATVVPQAYIAPADSPFDRPDKTLASWCKSTVQPGEHVDCTLSIGPEAFRRWDTSARAWTIDPGRYDVIIAESAGAEHARLRVRVR